MNGPEHYREAEAAIKFARNSGDYPDVERIHLAYAQAHATLALAAAQAMPTVSKFMGDANVITEWGHATGFAFPPAPEEKPLCGKPIPGTGDSCLSLAGHEGDCSDEVPF